MCHTSCILFGAKSLRKEEIEGKKVLEVGSYYKNGSIREVIESWNPSEYIGVDLIKGPGVDLICNAENLIEKFGKESFDVVITTELLEHVKDWKKIISILKNVCKPNGIILITTRSYGFKFHPHPIDLWRYEIDDMKNIFSDFKILSLEKDKQVPGVFIKLKKPEDFQEVDLSDYKLYNIVANKRVTKSSTENYKSLYYKKLLMRDKVRTMLLNAGKYLFNKF